MRSLLDEEWFHGVLPRDEVVRLLRMEGDFLVRETERNYEKQTVLSVLWGGRDKHFIVQTTSDVSPNFMYLFHSYFSDESSCDTRLVNFEARQNSLRLNWMIYVGLFLHVASELGLEPRMAHSPQLQNTADCPTRP